MSSSAPSGEPFRKKWVLTPDTTPGQGFSDSGHRREPLPESAAWNIVTYLLSGLLMFGLPGFVLDRVLGTTWIVGLGIVLGAALAILVVWLRYGTHATTSAQSAEVGASPRGRVTQPPAHRPTSTSRVPSADRPQEEQP